MFQSNTGVGLTFYTALDSLKTIHRDESRDTGDSPTAVALVSPLITQLPHLQMGQNNPRPCQLWYPDSRIFPAGVLGGACLLHKLKIFLSHVSPLPDITTRSCTVELVVLEDS